MQRLKKQKMKELLDAQNAAIDADVFWNFHYISAIDADADILTYEILSE